MQAYYGTEGIILAGRDRGEADKSLALYTRDLGLIRAFAKGVRLSKSKLKGHLMTYSRVRFVLARGKEFWRLIDAEVIEMPDVISKEMAIFATFITRVVGGTEPDYELWNLIAQFPSLSKRGDRLQKELLALNILGLLPDEEDMRQFFGVSVPTREDDFDLERADLDAIERGIERILAASHIAKV